MDLTVISGKVGGGGYSTVDEFVGDVRLVFLNCLDYWGGVAGSVYPLYAHFLLDEVDLVVKEIRFSLATGVQAEAVGGKKGGKSGHHGKGSGGHSALKPWTPVLQHIVALKGKEGGLQTPGTPLTPPLSSCGGGGGGRAEVPTERAVMSPREHSKCLSIVGQLKGTSAYAIFSEPPDIPSFGTVLSDYYQRIPRRMDFTSLTRRLHIFDFSTSEDFRAAAALIWQNVFSYYDGTGGSANIANWEEDIVKPAKALELDFQRRWEAFDQTTPTPTPSSSPHPLTAVHSPSLTVTAVEAQQDSSPCNDSGLAFPFLFHPSFHCQFCHGLIVHRLPLFLHFFFHSHCAEEGEAVLLPCGAVSPIRGGGDKGGREDYGPASQSGGGQRGRTDQGSQTLHFSPTVSLCLLGSPSHSVSGGRGGETVVAGEKRGGRGQRGDFRRSPSLIDLFPSSAILRSVGCLLLLLRRLLFLSAIPAPPGGRCWCWRNWWGWGWRWCRRLSVVLFFTVVLSLHHVIHFSVPPNSDCLPRPSHFCPATPSFCCGFDCLDCSASVVCFAGVAAPSSSSPPPQGEDGVEAPHSLSTRGFVGGGQSEVAVPRSSGVAVPATATTTTGPDPSKAETRRYPSPTSVAPLSVPPYTANPLTATALSPPIRVLPCPSTDVPRWCKASHSSAGGSSSLSLHYSEELLLNLVLPLRLRPSRLCCRWEGAVVAGLPHSDSRHFLLPLPPGPLHPRHRMGGGTPLPIPLAFHPPLYIAFNCGSGDGLNARHCQGIRRGLQRHPPMETREGGRR